MYVHKSKHSKKMTSEEWEWLSRGPGILNFLENKFELIIVKDRPSSGKYGPGVSSQLNFPKLIEFLESQCESIFYFDHVQTYEEIQMHIYFGDRNDFTKCKMSLPPAIENNEFAK